MFMEIQFEDSKGKTEFGGPIHQGQSVSSGVYMYRLRAGKQIITRKMVLLR